KDQQRKGRAELHPERAVAVFEQSGDYEHGEAVKKRGAMRNVDIDRRQVLGCGEHALILDDSDQHAQQEKEAGRQKTEFDRWIHCSSRLYGEDSIGSRSQLRQASQRIILSAPLRASARPL